MSSLTKQQTVERLIQNGITREDLAAEFQRGFTEGGKQAGMNITKCCYAGIVLVLHEEFGFDEDQCYKAVCALDKKVLWALDHRELADKVLEETGLTLYLDEPFERVEKREGVE